MTRWRRPIVLAVAAGATVLLTAGGCQHDESLTIENVVVVKAGTATTRDLQFGSSPWMVPSGTAGQMRLYFATGFGTPLYCTLSLDGERQLTPTQVGVPQDLRFFVEYPTSPLRGNQSTKGTLTCPYEKESFGKAPPSTSFTVTAAPVLRPAVTASTTAPSTQVGSTSDFTITVDNAFGGRPFTVEAITFEGPGAPAFRVVTSTCEGRVLTQEQSCTVIARFVPGAPGSVTANVTVLVQSSDEYAAGSDLATGSVQGTGTEPPPPPPPPQDDQPHHPPVG
jgi:hypothetical protein